MGQGYYILNERKNTKSSIQATQLFKADFESGHGTSMFSTTKSLQDKLEASAIASRQSSTTILNTSDLAESIFPTAISLPVYVFFHIVIDLLHSSLSSSSRVPEMKGQEGWRQRKGARRTIILGLRCKHRDHASSSILLWKDSTREWR